LSIVHTHRHSEFSLLDGVGTAQQYADQAAALGMPALTLTDHGTLSGALHHYEACKKAGVMPILGVEVYFRPNRLQHDAENKEYYHLVLIAKDLKGWHNLMRITSEAYHSGFYYKPCVDFELLDRYSEGVLELP
jgi:DNA polymerase-3 subunit alpha